MSKPTDISDDDFEVQVLKSDVPVLVDFWAEWCAPCRQLAPLIDELAVEYDGQVKFTKVNVDLNPQSSAKYGVRSIPTLVVFKNGKPAGQLVGGAPKSVIKKKIMEALA